MDPTEPVPPQLWQVPGAGGGGGGGAGGDAD